MQSGAGLARASTAGASTSSTGVRAGAVTVGAKRLPAAAAPWLGGAQQTVYPPHRVGGSRGEGGGGIAGLGENDHGGGERP
jgi:hypothetical protein